MPPIEEISKYIQADFSQHGVEVKSQGPRSLTVEFPIEFHDVGSFCAGVEQQFGARVDLIAPVATGLGSQATIWLSTDQMDAATSFLGPISKQVIYSSFIGLFTAVFTVFMIGSQKLIPPKHFHFFSSNATN